MPLVLYNKIWFIYLDIAQKSNTEADAFEHLVQTKEKKRKIALQSQCLVSTDEPLHILHIKILKATKPAFIKEKTLKKKASRFHFTFNPETSLKKKNIHNEIMNR